MSSFKTKFDTLNLNCLEIAKSLKGNDNNNNKNLNDLFESTRLLLESTTFQADLNLNLISEENNSDEIQFISILMKNCLKHIRNTKKSEEAETCFRIIEILSSLKCMKLISIKSSLLVRILKLESLSAKRLLQVTLALSENNFNDKILFKNERDIFDTLEIMDRKFPNLIIVHEVVSNLKQKSFKKCLCYFDELVLNEKQMKNVEFLKNLRFVSNLLNGRKEGGEFCLDLSQMCVYNTFQFFCRLLRFLLNKLYDTNNARLRDELVLILRDLLDITLRVMDSRPLLVYQRYFIDEGIFQICVDFVYERNYTVIKLLFNDYPNILEKLMRIFLKTCQFIYYKQPSLLLDINEMSTFRTLRKSRDILSELSIFKDYLHSLAYLETSFSSYLETPLLSLDHYKLMSSQNILSQIFSTKVSNEYLSKTFYVDYEFINDLGEIESQRVTKLDRVVLVEEIEYIRVFYSRCDDVMQIGFNAFKYFFKSILFYGLYIEKILCLNCLLKWILVDEIRNEIVDDREFYVYLEHLRKNLHLSTNEDKLTVSRLEKCLGDFFMLA
jgi:hypothetical protein